MDDRGARARLVLPQLSADTVMTPRPLDLTHPLQALADELRDTIEGYGCGSWSLTYDVLLAKVNEAIARMSPAPPTEPTAAGGVADSFQQRVHRWMQECFGIAISRDKVERNYRFLEESLELVQALGCSRVDAHELVEYVYNRPVGEPLQEVGGVMVTLAALCTASHFDMDEAAETELTRIWTKVEQIREKQANKPKFGPLPQAPSPPAAAAVTDMLKQMVDRFLGWKLPQHFMPDAGIKFDPHSHDPWGGYLNSWPTGTNLFDATQAQAMLEHVTEPLRSHITALAGELERVRALGKLNSEAWKADHDDLRTQLAEARAADAKWEQQYSTLSVETQHLRESLAMALSKLAVAETGRHAALNKLQRIEVAASTCTCTVEVTSRQAFRHQCARCAQLAAIDAAIAANAKGVGE